MRAARRSDKSSHAHEIPLKDANGFHIAYIGIRDARAGVVEGVYQASYAPYRLGTPIHDREIVAVSLTSHRAPSYRAKPPITRGEAEANAGLHGESRTLRLNELQKALRVLRIRKETSRIVDEQDHIERAKEKIAMYPVEVDRKAVRTGPLPDKSALAAFAPVLATV